MVTTPSMQFLWKNFRPLLKGKVLYTPDTPAARLLVEEVRLFVCLKSFYCFYKDPQINLAQQRMINGDKYVQDFADEDCFLFLTSG